ncbi:MAG TPA: hypothetical protein VF292_03960 [Rhodanobacteraceae bacterium]
MYDPAAQGTSSAEAPAQPRRFPRRTWLSDEAIDKFLISTDLARLDAAMRGAAEGGSATDRAVARYTFFYAVVSYGLADKLDAIGAYLTRHHCPNRLGRASLDAVFADDGARNAVLFLLVGERKFDPAFAKALSDQGWDDTLANWQVAASGG